MKKITVVIVLLLLLIATEILKVYFIMPFPGSQKSDTINLAYFIHHSIWSIRIVLVTILLYPLFQQIRKGKLWEKIILYILIATYAVIAYAFNFKFLADKIFEQPKEKSFAKTDHYAFGANKLIIGVALNGESKAYPIEVIAYHHQIRDTLGNQPIMVTYCSVCRTGRVFSPLVNGKNETFRLVGMDHFNAMFEDESTKSWWQQATGIAIAGKLKGTALKEIPSEQMALNDWSIIHPNTLVLEPDHNFKEEYDSLKGFDEGIVKSKLEKRDSASWKNKSWVVGVVINNKAKAYDWNKLQQKKTIQDSMSNIHLLLTTDTSGRSFFMLNRAIDGKIYHFTYDTAKRYMTDSDTHSLWNANGSCLEGSLKGKELLRIQAYQEFWHSWKNFYPETETYK